MAHTPTRKIRIAETVNCYCFNPLCSRSIFYPETCAVVKKDLTQVLTGGLLCEECKSELISKPALEIKKEITESIVPYPNVHTFKYVWSATADKCIVAKQN